MIGTRETAEQVVMTEGRVRRLAWLLTGLGAVWLLGLWWAQLDQPIYGDEIAFVLAALVVNTPDPTRYIIPHPPLVIHLMAATLVLPLPAEQAMRVVGLLAGLTTIALFPPAARVLLPGTTPAERRVALLAGGLAAVLYAAAPLAVQGASLLDIDNSWLTPLTFAPFVVWGSTRIGKRTRIGALSVLLALALWTKLLTTPFIVVALGLYTLLRRDWRGLREVVSIALIGTALFAVTFLVYVPVLRFPVEQFTLTSTKTGDIGGVASIARQSVLNTGILLVWLGVAPPVLWATESVRSARRLLLGRPIPLDALALFAWGVLAFYLFIRDAPYAFPRYHLPMLPAMALMSAWPVARIATRADRREIGTWLGLIGVGVLFTLLVLGDPLLPQYHTFGITSLGSRVWAALRLLLAVVPLLLLVGTVLWALDRPAHRTAVTSPAMRSSASIPLVTLFCAGLGIWLGTDLAQGRADYALRYSYGRTGTWRVVARVADAAAPTGPIVAPQEILYHARRRGWYSPRFFCPTCDLGEVLSVLEQRPAFIIFTPKEALRYQHLVADPRMLRQLNACYSREQLGDYLVYARQTCLPREGVRGTISPDYQP